MGAVTMVSAGDYESSGPCEIGDGGEDLVTMADTRTVLEVSAPIGNNEDLEFSYGSPAPALSGATLNVPPGAARKVASFSGAQVRIGGQVGDGYRIVAW